MIDGRGIKVFHSETLSDRMIIDCELTSKQYPLNLKLFFFVLFNRNLRIVCKKHNFDNNITSRI